MAALAGEPPDMERPEDLCPGVEGPQRAIVAMSRVHNSAVVVSASCGVCLDLEEAGVDAGDIFSLRELEYAFLNKERGRDGGLRVWHGAIAGLGNDGEYRGAWRDLTPEEAAAVASGADPFRCARCDGSGFIDTEAT